ncbi:multidrug efflux MFS transporter periplasmic adaptor subunit EmrA [Rosenbergiella sp. S61]|uniref:Multidrug efflux MFS transporter periplasmic adaptor subunit EmrA n=1 Tax=Rosenbergiella gaditana TaxID=2726987 RepID=A0ABS5SZB2_9GAMM|nr:multidrug efflux MFS transporter periplasmic adaptor subunit EmrA [Rosenbergiella gaditana]MBT0725391.1 multidrug efflux MFS transporter periplasmic adaptor subunit EmrA [Rosenbergiella gaditana]
MSSVEKAPAPTSTPSRNKRKPFLMLLLIACIIVAIAYGLYWFLILSHQQDTDDAYVAGNQVQISPQVSGSVSKVWFDNTDLVHKGDILVSLDKTDANQTLNKAETALASSVRQVRQLMINNRQYQANIVLKRTALAQAEADLARREPLAQHQLIGREELQHARDTAASARASLDVAIQQLNANQAMILDTPLDQQPVIQQSAAAVRDAWLALQRTDIRSPIDGYVSRRSVQVGAQISPSSALMVVVPSQELWVDANFKETQLSNVRIGQPVTVTADIYGDAVTYRGKVVGLDMGTGSAFSLLPAQNATGNWIKVVQRLPVRVSLDQQDLQQHPLRIGLSTQVTIDVSNTSGQALATVMRKYPAYESDALTLQLEQADHIIQRIITANAE